MMVWKYIFFSPATWRPEFRTNWELWSLIRPLLLQIKKYVKTKVSINNSIPRLLKDQNLVTTTLGVERIHGICYNCPKNLEIQVKCPKTKESGFFEGKYQKASKILIPHSWLVIGNTNTNAIKESHIRWKKEDKLESKGMLEEWEDR